MDDNALGVHGDNQHNNRGSLEDDEEGTNWMERRFFWPLSERDMIELILVLFPLCVFSCSHYTTIGPLEQKWTIWREQWYDMV